MPKEDYRWIRTWGELMNSKRSYINDEIRRARASHAPENAINSELTP